MKSRKINGFIIIVQAIHKSRVRKKKQYIKQEEIDLQIDNAIKSVVIDESLADYINVLLEESYNTYKKPFCYFVKCNLTDVNELVDFIKNNISK